MSSSELQGVRAVGNNIFDGWRCLSKTENKFKDWRAYTSTTQTVMLAKKAAAQTYQQVFCGLRNSHRMFLIVSKTRHYNSVTPGFARKCTVISKSAGKMPEYVLNTEKAGLAVDRRQI